MITTTIDPETGIKTVTETNATGQKREESRWENGQLVSKNYWYKTGQKWAEYRYENGQIVSEDCWGKDGTLTHTRRRQSDPCRSLSLFDADLGADVSNGLKTLKAERLV